MNPANILIIEDSPTQKMLLQTTLEEGGYSVTVSKDGAEALEYIKNNDFSLPNLIISDIVMSNMDVYELCNQIKKSSNEIFIILLTVNEDEETLKKSFKSGLIDFLAKPFNKTELLLRVNNVLRIEKAENSLKKVMGQLAEKNKILNKLSITDELTNLYNRRQLIKSLKEKIYDAERYSMPLSIILFDIDYFKKINDNYGHLSGDEVLRKVSSVFMKGLRKTDIAGRYGGEEFLLVFPNTPLERCLKIAKTLSEQVEKLTFKSVPDRKITVSGGVCEYNNEIKYEDFLSRADDLLYIAKNNGKGRIEV